MVGPLMFVSSLLTGACGLAWPHPVGAQSYTLSRLASFNGANGNGPFASPILDAAGNLFGTTALGGANKQGVVFELPVGSSSISPVASFNGANGSQPFGGVVQDAQGDLFGTATF